MAGKEWFHGTPHVFEAFDPDRLGQGNDQLGSGFYFTDKEATALGYAEGGSGGVMVVSLDILAPLPENASFTRNQIEAMLRASPLFDDLISNWGEVAFEGEATVVGRAVSAYEQMCEGSDDALQVLNAISNDLWGGYEADFLRAVREATGHDGLFRSHGEETHAVAWFPEQVTVLERRETAALRGP